jgi:hypothetical protein
VASQGTLNIPQRLSAVVMSYGYYSCNVLAGKSPLGRARRRWENNMETTLKRSKMERCDLD